MVHTREGGLSTLHLPACSLRRVDARRTWDPVRWRWVQASATFFEWCKRRRNLVLASWCLSCYRHCVDWQHLTAPLLAPTARPDAREPSTHHKHLFWDHLPASRHFLHHLEIATCQRPRHLPHAASHAPHAQSQLIFCCSWTMDAGDRIGGYPRPVLRCPAAAPPLPRRCPVADVPPVVAHALHLISKSQHDLARELKHWLRFQVSDSEWQERLHAILSVVLNKAGFCKHVRIIVYIFHQRLNSRGSYTVFGILTSLVCSSRGNDNWPSAGLTRSTSRKGDKWVAFKSCLLINSLFLKAIHNLLWNRYILYFLWSIYMLS